MFSSTPLLTFWFFLNVFLNFLFYFAIFNFCYYYDDARLHWVLSLCMGVSSRGGQGLLSSCGAWVFLCGGFSCCGAWGSSVRASVFVVHVPGCPTACGIFPD